MGVFICCFPEEKEGQSILLVPAVFQVSLVQNNPYAKGAYFGVAYFAMLHVPSV